MNALEKLREATHMLAEVRTAQDAKRLMDMAAAAQYYAEKAKLGQEAIDYAHSIHIDAMRLLGGFLKTEPKATGGQPYQKATGTQREPVEPATPTLAELGLSKKESSAAQLLDTIAAEQPEEFAAIRSGDKTVTEVRRSIQRAKVKEAAALPSDKYRVIYADPPWKYGDDRNGLEGAPGAEAHYPTMSISQLCAIPVGELLEDNAVLFLWVTSPILEEAFPVIKAWGFTYRASVVWNKDAHNMGHYVSVRHEFLLICVRGSCLPDIKRLLPSVVTVKRTRHSEKPEEFRKMIDQMYPSGRRIELFARKPAEGWERWGNQA